jgi:outer membrane protein X
MRRAFPQLRASAVLVATVLPLCVFAAPLRLQLVRTESTITDIPELSTKTLQERTLFGLTQALKAEQGKATLVSAAAPEGADVVVGASLGRTGTKFRLAYVVQVKKDPKLRNQLVYEFSSPRLSDKGVTVMAGEIIAEAVKLNDSLNVSLTAQAEPRPAAAPAAAPTTTFASAPAATPAPAPAPAVASAPASRPTGFGSASSASSAEAAPPAAAPTTGFGATVASKAEAAPAADEPLASSAPLAPVRERKQPLIVVHSGLAGLWGHGTQSYGIGAVVEPKWNITDSIAVGLRFDGGVLLGGRIAPDGASAFAFAASSASLLKGEYLLGDSGVRPFAGLGAGLYALAGQSVSVGNEGAGVSQVAGQFYGIAPQLGLDFGGLRLGLTYNLILGADIVIEQNVSVGLQAERIPRNYVQLELSGPIFQFAGFDKLRRF